MREKIARAMMERAKVGDIFCDMSYGVREAALDNLLLSFEALVDVALDVLLKPTREMEIAAMEPGDGVSPPRMAARFDKRKVFVAMIQAALDGK